MKWNNLDEMGQEFVYRTETGINAYVWRERILNGTIRWSWQVSQDHKKITGHTTIADAAFDQAENAIWWLGNGDV